MDTKTCARCGAPSAADKRFCADCGASLDSAADVRQLIDEQLAVRLKDRHLLEVETAQAVVARVGEWAKLFGFFVAVPLGILVLILTILGFRQYSDFVRTVDSSRQELSRQLGAIKSEFDAATSAGQAARADGERLTQEMAEIRKTIDLSQAARLRTQLEALSERVSGIESRFKIDAAGVSGALNRSLSSSLTRFADYMEKVGFDAKQAPATVRIDSKPSPLSNPNTFYNLADRTVVVDGRIGNLESDPSMVLWPYAQHLLQLANAEAMSRSTGHGGALSNGVPDYFVASYLNDPQIGKGFPGEPRGYLRTAENDLKFGPAIAKLEIHAVGEIWAGAFWRIRQSIGQNAADRLVYGCWRSLRPADLSDASGAGVARKLVAAAREIDSGRHAATVQEILKGRNLQF